MSSSALSVWLFALSGGLAAMLVGLPVLLGLESRWRELSLQRTLSTPPEKARVWLAPPDGQGFQRLYAQLEGKVLLLATGLDTDVSVKQLQRAGFQVQASALSAPTAWLATPSGHPQ